MTTFPRGAAAFGSDRLLSECARAFAPRASATKLHRRRPQDFPLGGQFALVVLQLTHP